MLLLLLQSYYNDRRLKNITHNVRTGIRNVAFIKTKINDYKQTKLILTDP